VRAAASFGKMGLSLPSQKKFMNRTETTKRISVRNWLPWYVGGKSEDATRHLQNLAKIGYGAFIEKSFAKPEELCYYLIQLFASDQGDVVLAIGDVYGSMMSAAVKSGRRIINLLGPSEASGDLWMRTTRPRLQAVQERKDTFGISANSDGDNDASFVQVDPGFIINARLSNSSVVKKGGTDITFEIAPGESYDIFVAALRGFIPDPASPSGFSDLCGNRCIVIRPDEILDEVRLSEAQELIPTNGGLSILYERSDLAEDIRPNDNVRLVRVPFEAE
jgi:hypothetical protein